MSHRTQITLGDEEYARLIREPERTGLALAELVRRAVQNTYGGVGADMREKAVEESFGPWKRCHEKAREVVVLRRGGPVARLVPIEGPMTPSVDRSALRDEIPPMAISVEQDVRDLRNEERI